MYLPSDLAPLEEIVLQLLRNQPDGLSEYRLIHRLRKRRCTGFEEADLTDPVLLFRTHFLLFHLLYRLRDRLWRERSGHLQINPLRIVLQAYRQGRSGLTHTDPLRAYYLDRRHLIETTDEEVRELLDGFWRRVRARDGREQALEALGLSTDADFVSIKQRYRVLAMRHHPDRGGDDRQLRDINQAMAVLTRLYR